MSEYPSEWSVCSLGEITERVRRTSDDQNLDVLTISSTEGWVDQKRKWARDMAGKSIEKYTLLQQGEFSYNRGNSKTYPQGCVFRLESWNRALVPNVYHSFRIISPQIDDTFLKHFFAAGGLNNQLRSVITSSVRDNGLLNITADTFFASEIPVPPLPEQKKIAEILSGIDKQILSVKLEIQQARKISTAVTRELIGSIQDESLPLSEVAINHDSARVPIKSEERSLRNGPYRYYGASGVIDTIDDFLFDGDYILIGEDGANIIDRNQPLAFKVSGRFWVNNHAHIIQPRESCDINFLTYYLESLDYTGIASGSAQPKITRSALDAIQVPIPALEVQKKIGAVIESTIDIATTAEKKEKKLIDLKQALSADLLSGRKRVSV